MRTSFFGLEVATRGLFTSQRALDITSHNITNVNTAGYSRQVTIQKASQPMSLAGGTGMVGTGSDVIRVDRLRDDFLDFKYWSENVALGEWEIKNTTMEDMEAVFNAAADNSFNKVMDNFSSSLQQLSKNPGSEEVRTTVKQNALSLTKYFNSTASHFVKLEDDYNYAVKIKVDEVNSEVRQIRDLSEQIYKAELDGNVANDLRDDRTALLDKLSKLINVQATEVVSGTLANGRADKRFQLTLNGSFLVNHFDAYELECVEDSNKMYDIVWKDSRNPMNPQSGELKGYLDIRDGTGLNGSYKGVPYYMKKINEFAREFAKGFNEGVMQDGSSSYSGHASGQGLDGTIGVRFFSYDGKSSEDLMNSGATVDDAYKNVTALNLTLTSDITNDVRKIAAASDGKGPENGENALDLIKIMKEGKLFDEGATQDFMRALVANLGVDAQQAERFATNQDVLVKQIDNRRLSVAGVSIDEEMSNLVKYQHSYNAAAKIITVMDEVYDVMINRMGSVGR